MIWKFAKCKNWFDVAAHCYRFVEIVLERNDLTEENYVSRYVAESPHLPNTNPNIPLQRKITDQIADMVSDTEGNPEGFRDALWQVIDILPDITFKPFLEKEPNESTAIWSLLMAIDSAYASSDFINEQSRQRPLNLNASDLGIRVYLRYPLSSIARYLGKMGLCRIPEEKLQNQLKALIFFKKGNRKEFPMVRRVPERFSPNGMNGVLAKTDQLGSLEEETSSVRVTPRLRIGSCPFTSVRVTGFDASSPMEFVRGEGTSFSLRYHDDADQYYNSVIRAALHAAIERGCQILIFPEMVFASSFHERLTASLMSISDKGSLSLVIAGSTWDENRKTNSSTFYDCCGNKLGTYFKKRPFVLRSPEGDLVEDLSVPSNPDVLVDVPGIGRVVAFICKDIISDRSDAFEVIDAFSPQLVCIPAFSASVEGGFKLPMEVLAQRYLSISCIANYCAERNKVNPIELGYVCAPEYDPQSHSSHAKAMFGIIEKGLCAETCGKSEGLSCIEVIDINYASAADLASSPNISMEKIRF